MKKTIIICITLILIISILCIVIFITNNKTEIEEKTEYLVEYANTETSSEEEKQKIEKIIENQGLDGKQEIYKIAQEYDGREVVVIKPSTQYRVVMGGIIKKSQPEFSEIDELLERAPTHTGIWIEESSREQFLTILKSITKSNYTINEKGYLIQEETFFENEYDKKIKQMLKKEHLYAIDINSVCYIIDEVTGKIVEYPFEDMDPYSPFEYYETENKSIFVITTNSYQKLDYKDIIKQILENIVV